MIDVSPKRGYDLAQRSSEGDIAVNLAAVIRYVILALSTSLIVLGVLIMAGYMVPRFFPGEYRLILGAVVMLYGGYRFAIAYFRRSKEERS